MVLKDLPKKVQDGYVTDVKARVEAIEDPEAKERQKRLINSKWFYCQFISPRSVRSLLKRYGKQ